MKYKLYYKDSNPFVDEYIYNELKRLYRAAPSSRAYVILDEEEAIILKLKFPTIKLIPPSRWWVGLVLQPPRNPR